MYTLGSFTLRFSLPLSSRQVELYTVINGIPNPGKEVTWTWFKKY